MNYNALIITIGLAIIAYLIGSIPFGLIISKLSKNIDIRNYGSGNMGATNVTRVLGKKTGIYVGLFDLLVKGALPTFIAGLLYQNELLLVQPYVIGTFAVLGHIFPVFANFKGGKGVATAAGMLLGFNPLYFLICALTFVIIAATSKMISLASVSVAAVGVAIILIFSTPTNMLDTVGIIFLGILIIYKHKANIQRILNGNENKIGQNKSKL